MMKIITCTKSSFLLLFFSFLFFNILFAQNIALNHGVKKGELHHLYVTPDGKVGCTHDAKVLEDAKLQPQRSIVSSNDFTRRKPASSVSISQSIASTTFEVTYDAAFNLNTVAKAAFQKAVDNWSALITSTPIIRIDAKFSVLGANILGSAGTNNIYPLNVDGINSWYPEALTDALFGSDQNAGQPDIFAEFSSAYLDFYFGIDGNPPANKIDFVSVVMHEIGHGLGFLGSGRSGGTPLLPCTSTINNCWGYTANNNETYPEIYDRFIENNAGTSILTLTNPSATVLTFINTNDLFFDSPSVRSVNSNNRAKMYAPSPYDGGSSYSHFDETQYPGGNASAMMTPFIGAGESHVTVGPLGCALLSDIGWTMAGACATVLPIELSNFQAQNDGSRNVLKWTTLTERNNKVFKIERSKDGKNFTEIGEVKGAGTTDFPRSYTFNDETPLSTLPTGRQVSYYRLRQIDYDGKATPSNIVSVSRKEVNDIVLFPNPAKDKISFNTASFEPNRVVVYNNLGQIVMDKVYQINELDVSGLPSGLYVLELFSDSKKVNKRFMKN